jgi:glycosyltransferase involved in cell wall biosynthesis
VSRSSETPLSVVHVLAHDALAGTELMVAALAERSDPAVVRTTVLFVDRAGPVAERLRAAGVAVESLGGRGTVAAQVRLAPALRRARPDVLCGYGFRTGLSTRVLGRLLVRRCRTVTGVRGLYVTEIEDLGSRRGRLVMAIERLTAPLVDAYVANSPGALAVLADHGIPSARLRYIPNGIDADRWSVADRKGHTGVPVVACVGRFTPVKRQEDLVAAVALLRDQGVDVRLRLAGDGPLLEAVRAQVATLGLEDRVTLHGTLAPPEVAELLADADIACMPSSQEGMPGAVMEAMASGLPVVGTKVNGIAELVRDRDTGLLVEARDPQALADALAVLVTDPPLRHRMGAAGRRRIVDELSLEQMVEATTQLYRELTGAV